MKKPELRGRLRIFIIISVVFVIFILLGILSAERLFPNKPPVPLPTYTAKEISTVCQSLALDDEQWCKTKINHDANTLEETLNNHFPPGRTSYSDLSTIINALPSKSSLTCPMKTEFVTNNCPPPEQCHENYSCSVRIFTGSVLYVFFDYSTGKVTKYEVSNPGES